MCLLCNYLFIFFLKLIFSVLGHGYYLAAGGAAAQQNLSHIQNVIQDEKFNVHILDNTERLGLLSIQGPKR